MRDRQPIGNIMQQEVIEATCSSAQVPTISVITNDITPEPIDFLNPTFYPAPPIDMNNIPSKPAGKTIFILFF